MARLIPKISIDEISLKPERDVARALVEKLPNDCIVYHSYPWLRPERNDRGSKTFLKEGEADFVVIIPSHGVLILEVKGGAIEYQPEKRAWARVLGNGNLKTITDPFEQGRKSKHHLKNQIIKEGYEARESLPFTIGHAVIFPDCEYQGPAPPGADLAVLFSSLDLEFLDRRVKDALNHWCPVPNPKRLDTEALRIIQRGISPAFQLLPVLFRQVEEQEEKLFRLTEEQVRTLELLSQWERAAIEGVAGSGKTMLARAQAQRFADVGKRTLLVCYNKALAAWLRDSLPESYSDRIKVRHFHELCRELCNQAAIPFAPARRNQDQFWRSEASYMLLDALDVLSERFDAVVVDEGQDFYPDWWPSLEALNVNAEKGSMYVFYDPAQNLFVKDNNSLPDLGAPITLRHNCRNTRRIATTCGGILEVEIATHPDAPNGVKPKIIVAHDAEAQIKAASGCLDEWIKHGNLNPSQVAILCPNTWERSSLQDEMQLVKVALTDDLDRWRKGGAVLFSTIRGFKGLEADAVVMLDIPEPGSVPYFSKVDFYVGASRAKHLLAILAKKKGIAT